MIRLPGLVARFKKIDAGVKAAVFDGAHAIRNDILTSMRERKTGETYPVPGTKTVKYQSSAPGEAPAVATTGLINSIKTEIAAGGKTAKIGLLDLSSVRHGVYLEYGTSTIEPRPWLRPAYLNQVGKIKAALKAAIRDGR